MTLTAKTEAIAQITRAVRGLEIAIDKLEDAYRLATVSEKRKLLLSITELGERLDVNRIFLAHLKAAEVTVKKPDPGAYEKLDAALAKLQVLEVKTGATKKVIRVASALAGTIKRTRNEVSSRAT
jgi:hypothetical protein